MERHEMHKALLSGGWLNLDGGEPGPRSRYAKVIDGAAEMDRAVTMDDAYEAFDAERHAKTAVKPDKRRVRFEALRARYIAANAKRSEHDVKMAVRYGRETLSLYWTKGEQRTGERLREACDKAYRALFDYIQSISPRDWSYGVPAHWVCAELSFEDAVRPKDESLSVVPPLGYGSTEHRV